jgi:hypothetical protein
MITLIRTYLARRRLAATLRPDPAHLARRAAAKRGWQTRKVT